MFERVDGLDARLYRFFYGGDSPNGTVAYVMLALTMLGSGWAMVAAGPLIAIPRTRRLGVILTMAVVVQSALVWALKIAIGRIRPWIALATHPPFGAPPHDFSCPSGHATGSFTVATFLAVTALGTPELRHRKMIATALLALAAAIASSRVYLGVHYPGDVAAGAMLGGAVGFAAARVHLRGRARARSANADARL